jgi:hypothetical protein
MGFSTKIFSRKFLQAPGGNLISAPRLSAPTPQSTRKKSPARVLCITDKLTLSSVSIQNFTDDPLNFAQFQSTPFALASYWYAKSVFFSSADGRRLKVHD